MDDLLWDLGPEYAPLATAISGNETLEQAQPIGAGTHEISGAGIDWIRIEAQAGILELTMTPTGARQDLNMELRNAAGDVIRAGFTPSGPETIRHQGNAESVYYIRTYVSQFGDAPPPGTEFGYRLDIDLPQVVAPDGNNSRASATPLTEGRHEIIGREVDWFRLDTVAGRIAVTMNAVELLDDPADPRDDVRDLNMVLYNAAGQAVRSNFQPAPGETIEFLATEDGPYYLQVMTAQFGANAPDGTILSYTLDIDLPEAATSDGNDTMQTATPITEGRHSATGTGVDWYRFDTLSGLLDVTMTQSGDVPPGMSGPLNLNVELYDAAGNSVKQGFSDGATERFDFLAGSDATYFLKVYWAPFPDGAPNGVTLSYTLDLDLPEAGVPDGNDTRATADTIGTGNLIMRGTGVDWFRLASGPGEMSFAMTPIAPGGGDPLDLNMQLYDSAGNVIRSDITGGGAESFSHLAPLTGDYFLKVYWAPFPNGAPNGYTLDYTLQVDLPQGTWSKALDFGPVRNASVAAYDIDNDGRDEIFVGTSKALDAQGNEVRPAGLIVLEDDGTVKWARSFDAAPGPDPKTGKTYNTTSVTTAPTFSDIDNDGRIDILVGVGADNRAEFDSVGQPGDLGGLYALNADGTTKWFHQTRDAFGDDGRPDGIYGAPRVFDIDADGVREVLVEAWDHYLYVLNGKTGAVEREVNLHDTAGATPGLADLDRDGLFEMIVPADITDNSDGGLPAQGGILHVLSNYGNANVPGWMDQVFDTTGADFRGKFEPQSLWSSPKTVDLDRDGRPEIVLGTGNFFQDDNGQYIKVWNADGTLRFELPTTGRTLPAPLIADLDGNGTPEIVAATIAGHVHAWNANGQQLFATKVQPHNLDENGNGMTGDLPIVRQPIAVDIDNDGDLEILVSVGSQMIVLDSDGTQISSTERAEYVFSTYSGSPLAHDIDGDGRLDLITGGTTDSHDQAVVFRFENLTDTVSAKYRTAAYQDNQSLHDIRDFVDRFYSTILGRAADPAGRNDWVDELHTGVQAGADVARGFINSREFTNRATSDTEYVNVLYAAFFGRAADQGGFDGWMTQLAAGTSRAAVLDGFIGSREFINLSNSYGIRPAASYGAASNAAVIAGDGAETNILRGGSGNNVIYDEGTGVEEVGAFEKDIAGQVYRLYGATLGRSPDSGGFQSWFNGLNEGRIVLDQTAAAFVNSREFQNTYGALSDTGFVELLYRNVLGRAADAGGLEHWTGQLTAGTSRADVVLGFSESREFQKNTNPGLDGFMRDVQPLWNDVLEGGAGNDTMNGGTGSDVFVFRAGQGGSDIIHGFEPWDELQLSGFGFNAPADALARMGQSGANVVFSHAGQAITFLNTTMADMTRVRYNLS